MFKLDLMLLEFFKTMGSYIGTGTFGGFIFTVLTVVAIWGMVDSSKKGAKK